MRIAGAIVLSLSLCSCAAVFRGSKEDVELVSAPPGADATMGAQKLGITPTRFQAPRKGKTQITVVKSGFEDHHGLLHKSLNPAWVTLDAVTCIFTFCIPLIIDAATGGWTDVDEKYVATMKPGVSASLAAPTTSAPTVSVTPSSAPPPATMSEVERKATARAAYSEGIAFQEKNDCADALPRFEAAQKFYPAPTHQLHIAQCQASTGKLLEAVETYESLAHVTLAKDGPEAFHQAQDEGNKALTQLRPRVPTLRVQVTPAASSLSSLVVRLNGTTLPNEVLGIARPVNPGHYKVVVWAAGYKEATAEVDVVEGAPRAVDLKLFK